MFDLNGDGEVDYGEFEKVSPQQAKPTGVETCTSIQWVNYCGMTGLNFKVTGVRKIRLGVSRVNGFVSKEIYNVY